jgi:hypothetical protein
MPASRNLTYVGRDMPESGGTGFETEHMLQLYRYGYDKARERTETQSDWHYQSTETPNGLGT